jgi:glutamine synthetase
VTADVVTLKSRGVVGVTIAWADNNGILRSRTIPVDSLESVTTRGVGITPLFAVFDSHDGITFSHEGLSTPSGDIRLLPVVEHLVALSGQPQFAWVPGRQVGSDGSPWPYDQRTRLEAQVARAAARGLSFRVGYELEFYLARDEQLTPGHSGPAYGPLALLAINEFVAQVLGDLAANGVEVGQLHAEYGIAQVEISLGAADPLTAADQQILARQTIHAAARAHGLRASFAPLVSLEGVGNGLHIHVSVRDEKANLLSSGSGDRPQGSGAHFLAGLLHELPALASVAAPSVPSLWRRRPGYFAGAYAFWGVENREAPLRYVPDTPLLGAEHANVELKAADVSANPYLALATVIAAGLAGIDDHTSLPDPIQEDPGTWDDTRRAQAGVSLLPISPAEQEDALLSSPAVREALGEELLGAFLAARRSDAAFADAHDQDVTIASHRWRY